MGIKGDIKKSYNNCGELNINKNIVSLPLKFSDPVQFPHQMPCNLCPLPFSVNPINPSTHQLHSIKLRKLHRTPSPTSKKT
jgi:hypothetical protein